LLPKIHHITTKNIAVEINPIQRMAYTKNKVNMNVSSKNENSNGDGSNTNTNSNTSSTIYKEDALGKNIEMELSSFDEDGNKECRIGTITRMKVSFPNDDVPSNFSNKNNQSLLDYKHYIKFVDYPSGWYDLPDMINKDLFNNRRMKWLKNDNNDSNDDDNDDDAKGKDRKPAARTTTTAASIATSSSVSTTTRNGNLTPITPEKKRKCSSSAATTATGSSSSRMKKEKKEEDKNEDKECVHQQTQRQPRPPKKKKKMTHKDDDDDDDGSEQQDTNYQEGNDEINIKEFEDWLRNCTSTSGKEKRPMSDSNARSVINRVKDLTSGRGIGYKNWPEKIRFCGPTDSITRKGPVTLSYNLHSLLQDAKEFEIEYGRDKGNGWLVQHPVKKLILYKDYITESRKNNHVYILD
jgi:hypothetical protein